MKKILVIFLAIGAIAYISYKNLEYEIIENKIYTVNIDFPTIKNGAINIDDTRIIEKSKEILTSIYGEADFDQFSIESNSSLDGEVYVYFIDKHKDGYFISFDVNEGVLKALNRLSKPKVAENNNVNSYKSVEKLNEISMENIEKLQVNDLENYKYYKYEIYNNFTSINYRNEKINKEIITILDNRTGEFLEYNYY